MILTPNALAEARRLIGERWGLGRGLTTGELAAALEIQGNKPGGLIHDMERGHKRISGPITVAVRAMLAGYVPESAPAAAHADRRPEPVPGVYREDQGRGAEA